jgi:hypothetical protein
MIPILNVGAGGAVCSGGVTAGGSGVQPAIMAANRQNTRKRATDFMLILLNRFFLEFDPTLLLSCSVGGHCKRIAWYDVELLVDATTPGGKARGDRL